MADPLGICDVHGFTSYMPFGKLMVVWWFLKMSVCIMEEQFALRFSCCTFQAEKLG
jgi:hypothetical protein